MYRVMFGIYFGFLVGMAAGDVGQPVIITKAIYDWTTPFVVGMVIVFPFLLGYFAGKNKVNE